MNREFEFFHGVALTRLVHSAGKKLCLERFPSLSNSAYIIDEKIGLYVKYCAKRMSPWRFTFKKEHQDEIQAIRERLNTVFVLLVCNDDGLVCLGDKELHQILDTQHDPVEWVSASRRRREMYTVKGSNGTLEFKVGANEFPEKLFRDPKVG